MSHSMRKQLYDYVPTARPRRLKKAISVDFMTASNDYYCPTTFPTPFCIARLPMASHFRSNWRFNGDRNHKRRSICAFPTNLI